MALPSGTKLGPYQLQSAIGAGGMGEVYRAHDGRLGRDVAIKVLPDSFAADAERLARFEQEARAVAALNHPNILAVYDIGEYGNTPYIVSELLEGETLRGKLNGGALPVRRAMEYALQIVQGLAAAHEKGIIHRDIKPENIFISKDGRAKILDFGLAKQNPTQAFAADAAATLTGGPRTTPGVMLGTVGYMSPEQVKGEALDHRSDIFSFGTVLYEMLSGERPFRRDTSAETMTAILKEDPPELANTPQRPISPGIDRIVRRCMEKDAGHRFQSAKDLAFALEAMSGSTSISSAAAKISGARHFSISLPMALASAVVLIAVAAAASFALFRATPARTPLFHQLTSSRGYVRVARFSPDGQTVAFGGMWNGDPMKLWIERADGNEYSPSTIPDSDLLAVSPSGELAVAMNRKFTSSHIATGMLARVPFTGGAPREVLDGVLDADWAPDGSGMAIVRQAGQEFHLEFPIGKVLYSTSGYVSHIRFSHHGDKIAFMDHPIYDDDRGFVSVLDLSGKKTVLTREWPSEDGLAWSPDDSEIWFTASDEANGNFHCLQAVNMSRRSRVIMRTPIQLKLHDITADGRVLLGTETVRTDITWGDTSTGKERDLTWFDDTWDRYISDDGQWIIFSSELGSNSTNYSVFARKTDGSPAVRLADGDSMALSPDGKSALAYLPGDDQTLLLIPLGAGETKTLKSEKLHYGVGPALWMPGGKNLLVSAQERGHGIRAYLQPVDGSVPKPVTPEGFTAELVAPDSRRFLAYDFKNNSLAVFALDGSKPRALPPFPEGDRAVTWLQDGRNVIFRSGNGTFPITTYQFDIDNGAKQPWKQFPSADKVGLLVVNGFRVTPDTKHYLRGDLHVLSTLFVVNGLK
jgi:eukaryotic-like serine/threonine-protein kinase